MNPTPKSPTKSTNLRLDSCASCGQADYILLEEGMHIARRCRNCGKWSRWVPHTPENLAACNKTPAPETAPLIDVAPREVKPEPAQRTAVSCDHHDELDRLIHHLRGIENHLDIVTSALMGQPLTREDGQ